MAKATYAELVYANERGMIEMKGGTWKDERGVLSGTWNGVVVTRMSIVDQKNVRCEFLLTTGAAEAIGSERSRFYSRGSEPGYVAMVTGRDPRLALQANAGAASGSASYDVKTRGRAAAEGAAARVEALLGGAAGKPSAALASLASEGASYVVVPRSALAAWKPLAGKELLGPDEAFFVRRGNVQALVLGTPDTVYAFPRKDGALLVRVVSFDADDDGVLAKHIASIDDGCLEAIDDVLETDGPLAILSAVVAGDEAETLAVAVPEGRYGVSYGTVAPDDGTELLVVKLTRSAKQTTKKAPAKTAAKKMPARKAPAKKTASKSRRV